MYYTRYKINMKEFLKKNFAILLAFLLPIALILFIALQAYLPSAFLSTQYNFVYTTCDEGDNYYSYRCNNYLQSLYSVDNGVLVTNEINPNQDSDDDGTMDVDENYTVRIFLHDTKKNESREITKQEAEALTLNSLLTSVDGVTVTSSYDRGADFFFIFDGGSSYGYYLTKGSSKSKLNLINDSDRYYYRDNFNFIGWSLPGRS